MEKFKGIDVEVGLKGRPRAVIIESYESMMPILKNQAERAGIEAQGVCVFPKALEILKKEKNSENLMDIVFVSGSDSEDEMSDDLKITNEIKREKLAKFVTLCTHNHTSLYFLTPEQLKEKGIDMLIDKAKGINEIRRSFLQAKAAIDNNVVR